MPVLPAPRLLVADRHDCLRTRLDQQLGLDGYEVYARLRSRDARRLLSSLDFAALIVGALEAPADAVALLRDLRSGDVPGADLNLPVLVLGAAGDELDELRALRAGADDWIARTCSYPLLLARVNAILRRGRPNRPVLRIGALELRPTDRAVTVHGEPLGLPAREFNLLERLMTEPTRVWHKRELLGELWGYPSHQSTRTLDAHACRLRKRLHAAGFPGVENVWGVGYRLVSHTPEPSRAVA